MNPSAQPFWEVTVAGFEVETEHRADDLWVNLIGEFDLLGFEEVDGLLARASLEGRRSVVVDLRRLTFIDSTGIRAMLKAHHRATEGGRRFRIVRGPDAVDRVFELTGLNRKLDFVETDDP